MSRAALGLRTRPPWIPPTSRGLPSPFCRVGCAGSRRQAPCAWTGKAWEGRGRALPGESRVRTGGAAAEGWGLHTSARARWEPAKYLGEVGGRGRSGVAERLRGRATVREGGTSRARAPRRDFGRYREIFRYYIYTERARVLSLVRFRPARLFCGTEVVYLRPPSLPPKCVLPPHGRFDGHGYEPSEAPELSFR